MFSGLGTSKGHSRIPPALPTQPFSYNFLSQIDVFQPGASRARFRDFAGRQTALDTPRIAARGRVVDTAKNIQKLIVPVGPPQGLRKSILKASCGQLQRHWESRRVGGYQ